MLEEDLVRFHPERDMLLTVGIFDGVHLGHKRLLKELVKLARVQNLLSGVVTFRELPEKLLSPETVPSYLTEPEEKLRLIREEGVDVVLALPFTRRLASTSARDFTKSLREHLRMKGLVVGPDFALGQRREGSIETLKKLGDEMGFSVTPIPPLVLDGEVVSSTTIRQALSKGDMEKVRRLTGRPFSLRRRVIPGAGRGEGLGFPTANLDAPPEQALPADGVYASFAETDDKRLPSITYIGTCPTFGNMKRQVEVHIPGYHENLYGKELKIDIILRLRPERAFENTEALKAQIREDIRQAVAFLDSREKVNLG